MKQKLLFQPQQIDIFHLVIGMKNLIIESVIQFLLMIVIGIITLA